MDLMVCLTLQIWTQGISWRWCNTAIVWNFGFIWMRLPWCGSLLVGIICIDWSLICVMLLDYNILQTRHTVCRILVEVDVINSTYNLFVAINSSYISEHLIRKRKNAIHIWGAEISELPPLWQDNACCLRSCHKATVFVVSQSALVTRYVIYKDKRR